MAPSGKNRIIVKATQIKFEVSSYVAKVFIVICIKMDHLSFRVFIYTTPDISPIIVAYTDCTNDKCIIPNISDETISAYFVFTLFSRKLKVTPL